MATLRIEVRHRRRLNAKGDPEGSPITLRCIGDSSDRPARPLRRPQDSPGERQARHWNQAPPRAQAPYWRPLGSHCHAPGHHPRECPSARQSDLARPFAPGRDSCDGASRPQIQVDIRHSRQHRIIGNHRSHARFMRHEQHPFRPFIQRHGDPHTRPHPGATHFAPPCRGRHHYRPNTGWSIRAPGVRSQLQGRGQPIGLA